jgi:hypothetical protein
MSILSDSQPAVDVTRLSSAQAPHLTPAYRATRVVSFVVTVGGRSMAPVPATGGEIPLWLGGSSLSWSHPPAH